ncbi:MAG: DUF3299 domain-containing protein [Oligoflexales bacterium]|nr:DUF3299 domain-containing protein [Oligoflexales bacterium]
MSALIAYFFPNISFLNPRSEESSNDQSSHIQLKPGESGDNIAKVVGWRLLQTLDYKNFNIPDDLKKAVNHLVRIPGFAVPLSDGLSRVEDFLLVPNQMACIHVPAPPPNLIVLVHLDKARSIRELSGPLWIEGVLEVKKTESTYGAAAYVMNAVKVEPYTIPNRRRR